MILRAGTLGLIDYSTLRPFDPAWHRRSRLVIRGLQFEDDKRLYESLHRHYLASLGVDRITADSLKEVQQTCSHALDDLLAAYRPWQYDKQSRQDRERTEAKAYKNAWEQRFGRTDDPEVQARLERARDAMLQMASEARPMTSEAFSGVFNKETAAVLSGLSQQQ